MKFQKLIDWLFGRIEPIKLPKKAVELSNYSLKNGQDYMVTADDLSSTKENENWEKLARSYGTHIEKLKAFNQQKETFSIFGMHLFEYAETKSFAKNSTLYLPSSDELVYNEFSNEYDEFGILKYKFDSYINSQNFLFFKTARKRSMHTIGKSYGTESLLFLSPNKSLAGASNNNTETINQELQYKINWGPDLWKCNIFMHDCVFDAGYQTHLLSNQHYITAGMLHNSSKFEKLKIDVVEPGVIMQLYSGNASNESHNLILASFIKRQDLGNNEEDWSFFAFGAEKKESAVSFRTHKVNVDENIEDFYEVTEGKRTHIRFFKAKFKR